MFASFRSSARFFSQPRLFTRFARFAHTPSPRRITRAPGFLVHTYLYNPEVFIAVGAGGLVAAVGGSFYYLYQTNDPRLQYLPLPAVLQKNQPVEVTSQTGGSGESSSASPAASSSSSSGFNIPLPFITVGFWIVFTGVSFIYARSQARLKITNLNFLNRVNFSLNQITFNENGVPVKLAFRTVHEVNLENLLLNNHAAIRAVLNAARKTSQSEAFIRLPATEGEFVLNACLNELSSLVAPGFFAKDLGIPTSSAWYVFGLTYEHVAPVKKLRVMLVKKSSLEILRKYVNETQAAQSPATSGDSWGQAATELSKPVAFETPLHWERLDTLIQLLSLTDPATLNSSTRYTAALEISIPQSRDEKKPFPVGNGESGDKKLAESSG